MIEIERKYLVQASSLPDLNQFIKKRIVQGYLQSDTETTIRVRLSDDIAFLTIKGKSKNLSRQEFEYEIPTEHALELMKLCGDKVVAKTRYLIPYEGKMWELDIFKEKLDGLLLAEIELQSETEAFEIPEWISKEVSLEHQFFNSNLSVLTAAEAALLVAKLS